MKFADRLRDMIPFFKKPPAIPADQVRQLRPVRNPAATWERDGEDQLVVIRVKYAKLQGWRGLIAKIGGQPEEKRIELSDEIASKVWELSDGQHTVKDICRIVAQTYKLGDRETEVSVLTFFNMLRSRKLIGAQIPEDYQAANTNIHQTHGNIEKYGDRDFKNKRKRPAGSRRY